MGDEIWLKKQHHPLFWSLDILLVLEFSQYGKTAFPNVTLAKTEEK